jgi:ribosome-binding factor A
LDDVQDQVKHIDDLLAAARSADAEVQRLAAQAEYAGEAQPYKIEDDDEEGDGDEPEASPGAAGERR